MRQCDNPRMQRNTPDDDIYSLFGIPAQASDIEITRAYRKLAMAWHPDRNASRDAEERFKRINIAYETLRDPLKRAEYDRQHKKGRRKRAPAEAPPRPSSDDMAGNQAAGEARGPRARDLSRNITISLAEQITGCRPTLKVSRSEYCGQCGGEGHTAGYAATCGRCNGEGRIRKTSIAFFMFRAEESECEDCGGSGRLHPACPACGGSGMGTTRRGELRIHIPAGVRPGSIKRVPGFGRAARRGESAGDLLVTVGLARHPVFDVAFPDLTCTMPVSELRMRAAGWLEVPTLEGARRVVLPADAGDGSVLRVDGHGLLDAHSNRRGNLNVMLKTVPTPKLSDPQLAMLNELERGFAKGRGRGDPFADWARRLDEMEQPTRGTKRER